MEEVYNVRTSWLLLQNPHISLTDRVGQFSMSEMALLATFTIISETNR